MYKILCKECNKEHATRNSKTKFCCDKCRSKYNKRNKGHKQTCKHCNNIFVDYKTKQFCTFECFKEYHSKKRTLEKELKEKEDKAKVIRKLLNSLSNMTNRVRKCGNCEKEFILKKYETGHKYCSQSCKEEGYKRTRNKHKKKYRVNKDKRWSRNGKADYSVSLKRLHERDNGVCHLCNKKTNYNDFEITADGYFIAGDTYPSIDHVIPIANGGMHRWDNVKLAHRRCNYIKSDNEIEFQMFLEI